MLLVCFTPKQNIIEHILLFIENHSVLVGVVVSLLTSTFWLRKFLRQKRAEAFFGFYSKLSLRIKSLQKRLEEAGQLNTSSYENGNIYSLIYVKSYIREICPGYRIPEDDDLKPLQAAATELKNILLDSNNNVYPRGSNRQRWYESQHIIFLFCEFLENSAFWHITNKSQTNENGDPRHIELCKSLVSAMNYIQSSINNTRY